MMIELDPNVGDAQRALTDGEEQTRVLVRSVADGSQLVALIDRPAQLLAELEAIHDGVVDQLNLLAKLFGDPALVTVSRDLLDARHARDELAAAVDELKADLIRRLNEQHRLDGDRAALITGLRAALARACRDTLRRYHRAHAEVPDWVRDGLDLAGRSDGF